MDLGQRMVDAFYSKPYIKNTSNKHETRTEEIFDSLDILHLRSDIFRNLFFHTGSIREKQNYIRSIHDNVNILQVIDSRIEELKNQSNTKRNRYTHEVMLEFKEHLLKEDYFFVKHPLGKSGYPDFLLYHNNKFLLWECKSNEGTNFLTGDHMPQPTDFDIYEFTSKAANRTLLISGAHIISKATHKKLLSIRSTLEEQLEGLQNDTETKNWAMQMRCAPYTSTNMITSHDENDWKSDMEKIITDFWSL